MTLFSSHHYSFFKKATSKGRSMVEMLAVLAIVGILSIGGIEVYKYASDKNHANTIANEVAMRAASIAPDKTLVPTDGTFTAFGFKNDVGKFNYAHKKVAYEPSFDVIVTKISKGVCSRLTETLFPNATSVTVNGVPVVENNNTSCGADNTFVFTYSMLAMGNQTQPQTPDSDHCKCGPCEVCVNGTCQSECTGCQTCVGGTCIDKDSKCAGGCQTCINGACISLCGECETCIDGGTCTNKCGACQECKDNTCISTCPGCQTCSADGTTCIDDDTKCDNPLCTECKDGTCTPKTCPPCPGDLELDTTDSCGCPTCCCTQEQLDQGYVCYAGACRKTYCNTQDILCRKISCPDGMRLLTKDEAITIAKTHAYTGGCSGAWTSTNHRMSCPDGRVSPYERIIVDLTGRYDASVDNCKNINYGNAGLYWWHGSCGNPEVPSTGKAKTFCVDMSSN